MKTFIRWQGNKTRYLKYLLPYVPKNIEGNYIEPFIGSGALFLNLQPERWIINDLNKDLVNIWKNIKKNPEELIDEFKKFGTVFKPKSDNAKKTYCKKRISEISSMKFDFDRAVLYLLMKYTSYMGHIFIKNKFAFAGLDLPIMMNDNYTFLKKKYFELIKEGSEFLNKGKGKIYNKDYKLILDKAKKGDFVFLDPPYFEKQTYQFNYNKDEAIDQAFLNEMKKEVKKLDKKGVKWIMTNADTKEVRDTFSEYNITKFKVFRRSANKYKHEIIITKILPRKSIKKKRTLKKPPK